MSDSGMAWHITSDLDEFDAAAGGFLAADPTRNTLLISIPAALRARGLDAFGPLPPRFGWFQAPGGRVEAAFVHTPPHPLQLSGLPAEGPAALAASLAAAGAAPTAVGGPVAPAEAFAAAWQDETGAAWNVHRRHRLYVLGTLAAVSPMPPGSARTAEPADRDLLVRWHHDFGRDVGETEAHLERAVDDKLRYGGLTLWQVQGTPVSMAGVTRKLADGGVRVAPVYTPEDLRGRGFAAAVTAAVSRAALDAGAREVSLFTDMANSTSNALYQRLGYRILEERVMVNFEG
jgi:ribosomal protein S18 acetylase RimI-like enzyme